jgi:hypothetical protein
MTKRASINQDMKLFLKTVFIFAASVILLTVVLFSASLLLQDKVAGIVLKSFNKDIQTKYEFEDASLSFIRNFPKASLELKNVLVHSSLHFDKKAFGSSETDTLLYAKYVSAAFSITDIIHGNYNIDRLSVRDGKLNILSDKNGGVNWDISTDTTATATSDVLTINLERINVSRVTASYSNLATRLFLRGRIESGKMKSLISGDDIDFTASGDILLESFRLYEFTLKRSTKSRMDISLHSSPKGILFRKSSVKIDNIGFGLSGFISEDDNIDLLIKGENIDISGVKKYLSDSLNAKLAEYNPTGVLNVTGSLNGPLTRTANPRMDIHFGLAKGHVSYLNSALNINNLSLKGDFSNGANMNPSTCSLTVTAFSFDLGSAKYSGSIRLNDFDTLEATLSLDCRIIPEELKDFFRLSAISSAKGSAELSLRLAGRINNPKSFSISDFLAMNPVADINFNSFSAGIHRNKVLIENINGLLHFSDTVLAKKLAFRWRGTDFCLNGSFAKLPAWIAGQQVILRAKADVTAGEIDLLELFPVLADTTPSTSAYLLPRDVVFDLNYEIGKLKCKTFSAEKINGSLNYKPGIANFKSLRMKTMDGSVSGNGFILQNRDKSFISRAAVNLEKIDINESFRVFHNFGQEFIKAENLAGKLSGNVSLLLPTDSMLNPIVKSVTAEGKYTIENGALIDFMPVQELSSFIEISELKNIHFETLENDFFIRNNQFYTPLMDVRSSAANLSVSGKQSFDLDYEYHVKLLLSEVLSKKIRKPKPNTTEFGAVRDDGLGRTSVFLKIINKGDDFKVSYDMKAAGAQIKNDFKNERKNLKGILNQEYGWFKKDTSEQSAPVQTTPRVRVVWGDADTIKTQPETQPAGDNENPFRNLFRKK